MKTNIKIQFIKEILRFRTCIENTKTIRWHKLLKILKYIYEILFMIYMAHIHLVLHDITWYGLYTCRFDRVIRSVLYTWLFKWTSKMTFWTPQLSCICLQSPMWWWRARQKQRQNESWRCCCLWRCRSTSRQTPTPTLHCKQLQRKVYCWSTDVKISYIFYLITFY